MNIWDRIFHNVLGWRSMVDIPRPKKCVLCIAPHTSNWDFIIAMLYEKSTGGHARFLMKKEWFFRPLSALLKSLGGIPVERTKGAGLTACLAKEMNEADTFQIAITPEGTRSLRHDWHTGFYHIALAAHVPILLFIIDHKNKCIICQKEVMPTAHKEADIALIKKYYSHYACAAKYPEKFGV